VTDQRCRHLFLRLDHPCKVTRRLCWDLHCRLAQDSVGLAGVAFLGEDAHQGLDARQLDSYNYQLARCCMACFLLNTVVDTGDPYQPCTLNSMEVASSYTASFLEEAGRFRTETAVEEPLVAEES